LGEDGASRTSALTEVNKRILAAVRDSVGSDEEWEFFCECGHSNCQEQVKLTLDAYVELHDSRRPVLADGHELSQHERARLLGEDADALRRQADYQVK